MQSADIFSLFCQPTGTPLFECLQNIMFHKYQAINVFIGPEGGFTQQEQDLLSTAQIVPCALTKSILRSQEAVAVSIGAIRCLAR
jgi:RsmE family RNA methyltransferase